MAPKIHAELDGNGHIPLDSVAFNRAPSANSGPPIIRDISVIRSFGSNRVILEAVRPNQCILQRDNDHEHSFTWAKWVMHTA